MKVNDIVYTVLPYENLYLCQFLTGSILFHVVLNITNVVFYCLMILYVEFLPMNFLFFQVVPARSRWFQLFPDSSSSFQVVPACSSSFPLLVYTNSNTSCRLWRGKWISFLIELHLKFYSILAVCFFCRFVCIWLYI